jgi:hypothetical protein
LSDLSYYYILHVIFPKELGQKLEVGKEVSFGSSRECRLPITGQGLAPLEGKFRFQNEVLTYTQMSDGKLIRIGKQVCQKGRMYILEKGDRITTEKKEGKDEKLKIIVRIEERDQYGNVTNSFEMDSDYDETDPNISIDSSGLIDLHEVSRVIKNPTPKGIKKILVKTIDLLKEKFFDLFDFIREFDFQEFKDNFKSKFGKKPPKKSRRNSPRQMGKKKFQDPTAGILPRFLGMFYNILIFVLFYFQGLPTLEEISGIQFSTFSKEAFDSLLPLFAQIPEQIEAIPYSEIILPQIKYYFTSYEHFNLFALFTSYELITYLLLGVGLGQFILGLRAKGNFLIVRLLSPIRVIFYTLTFPLFIFDIPIIVNKKSFKEKISLTSIQSKSKRAMVFNSLIILPIIIFLFCNFEIILHLISGNKVINKELVSTTQIQKNKNKAKDKDKGKDREISPHALFQVSLPAFLIHSPVSINLNDFFIPSVTTEGKDHFLKLTIYSPKEEKVIKVTQGRPLINADEIFKILRQDPSNIGSFAEGEGEGQGKSQKFSQATDTSIMESLYEIITFNIEDPIPAFEKIGLVSNPYQKIIRLSLERMAIGAPDRSILIKGTHENLITIERSRNQYQLSLLNLTSDGLMETRFEFDPKYRDDVVQLILSLWSTSKVNQSQVQTVKLLEELPSGQKPNIILGAFSTLISFSKIMDSQELSPEEIQNITNTFLQLSFQSLKTEDQGLQNAILDDLEKLDKWLLVGDKKNTKQNLSEFRLSLLRIQKALSGRDESFFELNK